MAVAARHPFCPSLCAIFTERLSLNPGWPKLGLGALEAKRKKQGGPWMMRCRGPLPQSWARGRPQA